MSRQPSNMDNHLLSLIQLDVKQVSDSLEKVSWDLRSEEVKYCLEQQLKQQLELKLNLEQQLKIEQQLRLKLEEQQQLEPKLKPRPKLKLKEQLELKQQQHQHKSGTVDLAESVSSELLASESLTSELVTSELLTSELTSALLISELLTSLVTLLMHVQKKDFNYGILTISKLKIASVNYSRKIPRCRNYVNYWRESKWISSLVARIYRQSFPLNTAYSPEKEHPNIALRKTVDFFQYWFSKAAVISLGDIIEIGLALQKLPGYQDCIFDVTRPRLWEGLDSKEDKQTPLPLLTAIIKGITKKIISSEKFEQLLKIITLNDQQANQVFIQILETKEFSRELIGGLVAGSNLSVNILSQWLLALIIRNYDQGLFTELVFNIIIKYPEFSIPPAQAKYILTSLVPTAASTTGIKIAELLITEQRKRLETLFCHTTWLVAHAEFTIDPSQLKITITNSPILFCFCSMLSCLIDDKILEAKKFFLSGLECWRENFSNFHVDSFRAFFARIPNHYKKQPYFLKFLLALASDETNICCLLILEECRQLYHNGSESSGLNLLEYNKSKTINNWLEELVEGKHNSKILSVRDYQQLIACIPKDYLINLVEELASKQYNQNSLCCRTINFLLQDSRCLVSLLTASSQPEKQLPSADEKETKSSQPDPLLMPATVLTYMLRKIIQNNGSFGDPQVLIPIFKSCHFTTQDLSEWFKFFPHIKLVYLHALAAEEKPEYLSKDQKNALLFFSLEFFFEAVSYFFTVPKMDHVLNNLFALLKKQLHQLVNNDDYLKLMSKIMTISQNDEFLKKKMVHLLAPDTLEIWKQRRQGLSISKQIDLFLVFPIKDLLDEKVTDAIHPLISSYAEAASEMFQDPLWPSALKADKIRLINHLAKESFCLGNSSCRDSIESFLFPNGPPSTTMIRKIFALYPKFEDLRKLLDCQGDEQQKIIFINLFLERQLGKLIFRFEELCIFLITTIWALSSKIRNFLVEIAQYKSVPKLYQILLASISQSYQSVIQVINKIELQAEKIAALELMQYILEGIRFVNDSAITPADVQEEKRHYRRKVLADFPHYPLESELPLSNVHKAYRESVMLTGEKLRKRLKKINSLEELRAILADYILSVHVCGDAKDRSIFSRVTKSDAEFNSIIIKGAELLFDFVVGIIDRQKLDENEIVRKGNLAMIYDVAVKLSEPEATAKPAPIVDQHVLDVKQSISQPLPPTLPLRKTSTRSPSPSLSLFSPNFTLSSEQPQSPVANGLTGVSNSATSASEDKKEVNSSSTSVAVRPRRNSILADWSITKTQTSTSISKAEDDTDKISNAIELDNLIVY